MIFTVKQNCGTMDGMTVSIIFHNRPHSIFVFVKTSILLLTFSQEQTNFATMKESLYAYQIPGQKIATISAFNLESGIVLYNVPVAYKSYGSLSDEKDNVIVVCHALTGNADLESWWGHLIGGPGKALDTTKYFIICLNSLGSPYGTASPLTYKDGDPAKGRYGPDFPLTTVRDDVK